MSGRVAGPAAFCLAAWSGAALALDQPTRLGPAPPAVVRRVVTLAPSLTESVMALGAGARLAGVSRFDEAKEVASLPRVGGFSDPSVEAVLGLKPDLVVVQPGPGNEKPVKRLAELGVPVLALPLENVAQVEAGLRALGAALGEAARGERLAQNIEASRAKVRALAHGLPTLKVLFVYDFTPLVVAGPGSFAGELLADAGAVNAAQKAKTAYPAYSVEAAAAAQPDVIVDAATSAMGRKELARLPGLRDARWVTLTSRDLLHPGPYLGRGLEELFHLLHDPHAASDAGH